MAECRVVFHRADRFRFQAQLTAPHATLELSLWTSPRGALETLDTLDPLVPPGFEAEFAGAQLWAIATRAANVHFEHLDRNSYYLGLSKDGERWASNFAGAGYLKLAPARSGHPRHARVQLDGSPSPEELREALAKALRVEISRVVLAPTTNPWMPPRAGRTIVASVTAGVAARGIVVEVESVEQELVVAARLARLLGSNAKLARTACGRASTVVEPDGSFYIAAS